MSGNGAGHGISSPQFARSHATEVCEALDEESWNRVVAALKRGPTPKQVEMKKLLEIASETRSDDDSSE